MVPPQFFFRPNFWIELIYSSLVIISCLVIYFKTREMYNLSSYRGIKYFSKAFMFFAIAYFFRFFFGILFRVFVNFDEFFHFRQGFLIGQIIYVYASTMAALYILYSVIWKKLGKKDYSWALHLVALCVTLITGLLASPFLHIFTLFILFSGAAVLGIFDLRKAKEKHQHSLFFVYTLILFFWILNTIAIELPRFMLELQVTMYFISLALFLIILWRVLKATGYKNEQKKRQA